MVVPGTPRDSLYIRDTLINIDAGPQPEVVTTDQASDSDTVFGIFSMLGYRFAPRFADLGDQRFWRADVPEGRRRRTGRWRRSPATRSTGRRSIPSGRT
ncbi:Tn3 family transposase [Nonomuraea sp. NPDC050153]|uniref:Tn3 family transposase n=1 Tax=Nonomuraea sp. NPDC050153 TaxID=3364359 RepID=UPI00378B8408